MNDSSRRVAGRVFAALAIVCLASSAARSDDAAEVPKEWQQMRNHVGDKGGVVAVIGLPADGKTGPVVDLARKTDVLVYFQSASPDEVAAMRKAAESARLLGRQIWVAEGDGREIQLADNLADAVYLGPAARESKKTSTEEIARVLHPGAHGYAGDRQPLVKAAPRGVDTWSHPYHGPDNNPQSRDQLARYPYRTQFLGEPMFGCISEVTVAAGGRVFKAFGHIAFKEISNEVLNTLFAINGYNGQILWKRPLEEGFMIHRNTMIATPETLYLADNKSCKLIDARTGELKREIKPPAELAGGTVWKWMALEDGVLYALLGGREITAEVLRGKDPGYGGWPWGMWRGYDYKDPAVAFGFGRNLMAIDPTSGKVLWRHQADDYLDGRALCLRGGKIFAYSPDKFLTCIDAKTGQVQWKNSDQKTLEAIGENGRAQGYIRGFSTTAYMKCSDDFLYFAGPQRSQLTAVSAADGSLGWTFGDGNFQLVFRDEGLYAFGKQDAHSYLLDPKSGKKLQEFPGRRACTRATGSVDSLFCRARGGTIRLATDSNTIEHIAPMRPACHDGVIISDGYLYWGPWICACQLTLFGHIGLGPAGDLAAEATLSDQQRLTLGEGDTSKVQPADAASGPTGFRVGADGVVRALRDKKTLWTYATAGGINFPPATWNDRVYVGSNDGHVYALEAATGRLLWRFRAAPQVRRIPVYGQLMSTWPVAGGVAVKDGTVYAAAGIAHYDGTHVFALDAITGKVQWHNADSGALNPELKSGVSLAGPIQVGVSRKGEPVLSFPGGNATGQATFDLETGKCLTPPPTSPKGVARSTFYVEQWLKHRRDRAEKSPQ